jgi:surface antigen
MNDELINDNIKMRLTSKSDSQDFDVYLRKYNITEGFWINFTKKVDEIEPFKVGKKTISKQDQVISLINAQKMSDSQKSALYRAMGYSDELKSGSVQKKVPWKYHWDIATTDNFENKVGMKVVDTKHQGYTDRRLNDAAAGQCVWFVRGRAYEKLGKYLPAMGDANQMYASAKESARLPITKDNILPNTLVSYKVGTSSAGQTAGHVIYIEDVVGDTVYYTEGGGSINGVVKKSTKDNIMKGLSGNNSRIGTDINGIIDVTKY